MPKTINIDPMEDVVMPVKKAKLNNAALTIIEGDSSENKTDNVVRFADIADVRAFADKFGLDLNVSRENRADRAVSNLNNSAKYMLAAGLDLLVLKEDCDHGEFTDLLSSRGFEERAARRAMQYVEFLLSRSETERDKLLVLPKSHVLAIASADQEVIEDLLLDDDKDLSALSVRELRNTIKEISKRKTNVEVQLQTKDEKIKELEAENEALKAARIQTGNKVPLAAQDMRMECAVLHKQGVMALDDIDGLMVNFGAELPENWIGPVVRNLHAAVLSLHVQAGNMLAQLQENYHEDINSQDVFDTFTDDEVLRCAKEYKLLIDEHKHREKVRNHERAVARQTGPGRPPKPPVLGE